ncbi:hypothetical protein ACU4GD_34985 [Cupriavidus basilensis]
MQRAIIELTTDYVPRAAGVRKTADRYAETRTRFKLAECKTEATIAATFVDDCMDATFARRRTRCPHRGDGRVGGARRKNCEIIDENACGCMTLQFCARYRSPRVCERAGQ